MKINWKQKLSSRKFWAMLAALVTALLIAFKVDALTIENATAIISALAVVAVYIFAEGKVDAARASVDEKKEGGGNE